ncbi:MAG: lytic transglycosylase domain-containing protein [Synergistaceae bacterium]|jgi:soluble lytic murein transglycosylase|nr:lytic transglycosylase domain-containing protein [Synergistaceae bacterium]
MYTVPRISQKGVVTVMAILGFSKTSHKEFYHDIFPLSGISRRLFFLILLIFFFIAPHSSSADDGAPMRSAFWKRDWGLMDSIYRGASSADAPQISSRDRSLYLNALWLQGRYADGVTILEDMLNSGDAGFPQELRPYAGMLLVLGQERTGRKGEAYENAWTLWNASPGPLKYYLAFALARLSRDLAITDESEEWFRRMLEFSPDKKRRVSALAQLIETKGVNADEAAELLAASPSNAKALAFCAALPRGSSSAADYALGYSDYLNKKYGSAMSRFEMASQDVVYGEAARYYHAYAAYREKKNRLALSLWSGIALSGDEFPQRSVQRLSALASRGLTKEVLDVLRKTSARTGFPDLAADALVGLIRLGEGKTASDAREELYSKFAGTNQAATARWESGWKHWKAKNYNAAYEEWSNGFSRDIRNRELASRLLYWQSRALEKIGSPVASETAKRNLAEWYPAEYHTFLADPMGGVISADVPAGYKSCDMLEEWGFVTYARLAGEAPASSGDIGQVGKVNIPSLYRSASLALWEGDYSSAARGFGAIQRAIPADEYASSEILKSYFPKAFEQEVREASRRTGIESAIIWGVMRQESLYEPDVTSSAGAYGLMQLMPGTARAEAKKLDMDADSYRSVSGNVLLGANHLAGLFARFKDAPRALAAYNAGGTPVARWSAEPISDMAEWVEDIGYAETRGYVKAVLRNIEVYRMLWKD